MKPAISEMDPNQEWVMLDLLAAEAGAWSINYSLKGSVGKLFPCIQIRHDAPETGNTQRRTCISEAYMRGFFVLFLPPYFKFNSRNHASVRIRIVPLSIPDALEASSLAGVERGEIQSFALLTALQRSFHRTSY